MISFRVAVNGRRVCTAAVGKVGVLDAMVSWISSRSGMRRGKTARLDVGGIRGRVHLEWLPGGLPLELGDRVTIELVETTETDRAVEFLDADRRREAGERCPHCGRVTESAASEPPPPRGMPPRARRRRP